MVLGFLFCEGNLERDHTTIDDIEAEGREEEEYTHPSKLRPVDSKSAAKVMSSFNADGSIRTHIKARKTDFVKTLIHLDGHNFDFTGREYLSPVYNRRDRQILLKTARQVEKCVTLSEKVVLSNGKPVPARDLKVGDKVVSFSGYHQEEDIVSAIENNGVQETVNIRTRKKRTLSVTKNHPVMTMSGYVDAGDLKPGDFVAVPHEAGFFGKKSKPSMARVMGYFISEGSQDKNCFIVTLRRGPALNDLVQTLQELGDGTKSYEIPGKPGLFRVYARLRGYTYQTIYEAMGGKKSAEKHVPGWIYNSDEKTTRAFLAALWAGDGHCKNVRPGKVDLCYSSISENLVHDVQALLLKFGILSTIRENSPTLYAGTNKKAYILRIIGRKSFIRFHDRIGPIPGKAFSVKGLGHKDQTDVIPKKDVTKIIKEILGEGVCRDYGKNTLHVNGLRSTPEHNLQRDKFLRYCELIDDERLWRLYHAEIFWDRVVSVEDAGEQETLAIEVKNNHNHVTGGIITHNSTFLTNNLVVTSSVIPFNKSLYVSPSHTQTRQFSSEKLKPAIEKSPLINRYLQDSTVSNQVFEKGFTNGSFIFLRSAFRSADRARGISARVLTLDEIQDLLVSDIPVIMECTSHFEDSQVYMAGTPKSFDNPIEQYWQESSQNEWLVPCSCGEWAFLDETTIAPTEMYVSGKLPPGPVCPKCMKPLNVIKGKWFSLAPTKMIQGYRIPQLMVPWIITTYDQWMKLLWKRDNYPHGQFLNEVLGLSYDAASKPITRAHLIKLCGDYDLWNPNRLDQATVTKARSLQLVAGVDWGEGNDGSEKSPSGKLRYASYTVLTIGYYETYKNFKTVLIKKYMGKEIDPDYVVNDIVRIIMSLGVKVVGADWGHGWGVNNTLIRKLGHRKVMVYQYLPRLKERIKWDKIGVRWQLQRNLVMSELFYDMKAGLLTFPKWAQFEFFAKDILAIYSEYSDYARDIRYDHRTSDPDDFFHSLLLCKQTADIYLNKSRRYTIPE